MAKKYAKGIGIRASIDRSSGEAVYEQIAASLRAAIEAEVLRGSTRLPSTRSLAEEWGVARNTVVQAFDALVAEGYLVSRVGDGTYVAEAAPKAATPGRIATQHSGTDSADVAPEWSRRGRRLAACAPASLPERPLPLMPDLPDLRAFPMRNWLRLAAESAATLTGGAVANAAAGFLPLRETIAHHVAANRGLLCDPSQVLVTTGSQQSLDLCIRLLTDPGDVVWMEDPGYIGIRSALEANGCDVRCVPVDREGLVVARGRETCPPPRLICVSPARQYPTGAVLSPRRRAELLDFAQAAGAWIIEDDYDSETHFAGPAPPALQAERTCGRTVFIGTFSKTLLPSLRLGYLVVPADFTDGFIAARAASQGQAPMLEQVTLAAMMRQGLYAAHLRRMRILYRARQNALVSRLQRLLGYRPPEWELQSGMHIVVPLRDGVDDIEVARNLASLGVVTRPLSLYVAGTPKRCGLIVGFAAFAEDEIARACTRLTQLHPMIDRSSALM